MADEQRTKQCKGCSARLLVSDPDLCELCDLHDEQPEFDEVLAPRWMSEDPVTGISPEHDLWV